MTSFEVVLTESTGVTVLTPWVSNLSFRSVDPGGFGSVTFDLSRAVDASGFEEQADVVVFDAETGEPVGGGRIVNPGKSAARGGDSWDISALGEGLAHMQERKEPYFLIDSSLDPWLQTRADQEEMSWTQGGPPLPSHPGGINNTTGLVFRTEEAAAIVTGDIAEVEYLDMEEYPDTRLGGYSYDHVAGSNTTNQALKASSNQFSTTDESDTFTLAKQFVDEDVADTGGSPRTRVTIRYERVGANFTASTKTWAYVLNTHVRAMRRDRFGDWIDTGTAYQSEPPKTHEVVIDCWARFCPRFDLANARVDESVVGYQQAVWPEGITPIGVLDFLRESDPGFTWAVWEKLPGENKWRAEWRAYDTDVRYELTTEDGFSETSAATKYVKVFASYPANTSGATLYTDHLTITSYEDPDAKLAARGITPSTTTSEVIPDAAIEAMLDESDLEASSAQVTVARKVFDRFTGRWVKPFQVLPGYSCRILGANPPPNALNAGQVDGAAIYKIVSNDYSTSSASSRLELNSYTLDERRAIANLIASQRQGA